MRGEGDSAGGAQLEGAEAGGGRFTHAHGVDGLKRDILRGGGAEAGSQQGAVEHEFIRCDIDECAVRGK